MPTVNTARGPVDTAELGQTLMHEHIVLGTPGIRENWPDLWNASGCAEDAAEKFRALEAQGIGTLVDVTTADMGRDAPFVAALQAQTRVNIIVCTGIYNTTPMYWQGRSADEMARAFVHDISERVQGTEIRAGIIKLATPVEGVTPFNDTCLRAGARAHRETGVPITTHAIPEEWGREQQRILREEGADLARVVIGHQGNTTDFGYFKELMDAGSCIGIDNFGIDAIEGIPMHDSAGRVAVVAQLCADGYADRIVLSHDANSCCDWGILPVILPAETNPNWHYSYISEAILPALKERGVGEDQLAQMLVRNPRRLFEAQGAY